MQTTLPCAAPGQGHIEGLCLQLNVQLCLRQGIAPRSQRRFNGLLGLVDEGALRLLVVYRQGSHALHEFSNTTTFT